ncbi:MAG: M1 family aminopeptidase [Candidatus Zixiibacteriota bacterium]
MTLARTLMGCLLLGISGYTPDLRATDDTALLTAFQELRTPLLDSSTARIVANVIIEHKDFRLLLDSGTLVFFAPLVIDGDSRRYGGIFEGTGRLQFAPLIPMEKDQLRRFFKSDSIDRSFERVQFWCNGAIMQRLLDSVPGTPVPTERGTIKWARSFMKFLTDDEKLIHVYSALQNLVHPRRQPYLLVNTYLSQKHQVVYEYDPYGREEVSFLKHYDQFGYGRWLEPICVYSAFADGSLEKMNGIAKDQIATRHYDITATISRNGEMNADVAMSFEVNMTPVQIIYLYLLEDLQVDSVLDSTGRHLTFVRYKKESHKSGELVLLMPRVLDMGEKLTLRFFYRGDVAEKNMGEFFVGTGAEWYPRYGYGQRATYDMKFSTPADYGFVATGTLVESRKEKHVLRTRYKQDNPAKNVAFNIGTFKQYDFEEEGQPPVQIHFSESMHNELSRALAYEMVGTGSHMERQVSGDVRNSLKLYSTFFGAYPHDRMVVSEILAAHSEAFPAFLHLGVATWISTDPWGFSRLHRSHEVAHQWWGGGVGYETYHDQWLSEGFSEYSAFMYLQATSGNDKFLDRLNDNRKEILSAHHYIFGEDTESGPIALGYRTASTKTLEDYDLIIYKKGAFILHMLRQLLLDLETMKEDRFLTMMQDFFVAYVGRNASTLDFKRLVERHTGVDMTWFFDQWVLQSAIPTYNFSYQVAPKSEGGVDLVMHVEQKNVAPDFKMYVPVEVELESGAKSYLRLLIDEPVKEFRIPTQQKPRKVKFNPFYSALADVNQ